MNIGLTSLQGSQSRTLTEQDMNYISQYEDFMEDDVEDPKLSTWNKYELLKKDYKDTCSILKAN